jgi:SAM-dependent methyltransferase
VPDDDSPCGLASFGESPRGRLPQSADDAGAAFKAFEAAGWSDRAATYGALMARATAHATEPLLRGVAAGDRVLDVGSGLGDLAAAAAARGAHATGIDLAPDMVRVARERHPRLTFLEGDAEDLPFEDGAFDVVVSAFVINHLPDPERAVAEMKRVARRVSLAMWAEETLLFALPTRAAGDAPAIPGPDGERFARRERLLGLLDGEVSEVTFELALPSFDALWDGLRGGTVRTAARLRDEHRPALERLAAPYRRGAGYALPTTVRVVSACCR